MNKPFHCFLTSTCLCAVLLFVLPGCGSGGSDVPSSSESGRKSRSMMAPGAAAPAKQPEPMAAAPPSSAPASNVAAASKMEMSGGMKNGLFPQFGGSVASSFGGGLFPQGMGMTSASSGNSNDPSSSPMVDDTNPGASSENESVGSWTPESPIAKSSMMKMALTDRASKAFTMHKEAEAMNLLYAHVLVSDDQNKYPLKWVNKLAEPRVALRWGVGVNFKKQNTVTGRFSVIGDPGGDDGTTARTSPSRGFVAGGGGNASRTGARTYREMDTNRPDGFLMYYTGDFGAAFINAIEKRRKHDDAFYGTLLKDIEMMEPSKQQMQQQQSSTQTTGGLGAASTTMGIIGGPSSGGGNGGGPQRQREDASIIERAKGNGNSKTPDDELVGTIVPGVMLVGQDKPDELIRRAREQSLDVLALFIVNAKQTKKGQRTSTTSLRFIDLRKDDVEPMYRSKQLKDINVEEAFEDDRDLVAIEIDRAFKEFADKKGLKTDEMPRGLKTKHVKNRINKILAKDVPNPLPACVEVVGFFRLNLISKEFAATALNKLLDSDQGADLLSDSPEKRVAAIAEWLPAESSDNDDQ